MNDQPRSVAQIIEPIQVMEGAGVLLKRSLGTRMLNYLDPFLLFDHFGSDDPADYVAGFPMHPHRGIETVTYMLAGIVRHRDTLGNSGALGSGDMQWMTAGRGILHEEMPAADQGKMEGFQLWVNLPAKLKMCPPRYQDVAAKNIPAIQHADGTKVRVIAGTVDNVPGAVTEIYADPIYLDVTMPVNASFAHPMTRGHTAFAYVFEGEGTFEGITVTNPKLVVLGDGDCVRVVTSVRPARFLLISGKPLNEPVARYGPFVMNTRAEIEQTLRELQNGTFVQS